MHTELDDAVLSLHCDMSFVFLFVILKLRTSDAIRRIHHHNLLTYLTFAYRRVLRASPTLIPGAEIERLST
jgi:hypothetical protein